MAKIVTSDPFTRTGFKHPKLLQWIRANRGQLVWSLLILVQHWIAEGQPRGTEVMGSFEEWIGVVGGILGAAGIDGLLANQQEFRGMGGQYRRRVKTVRGCVGRDLRNGTGCGAG